MTLFWLRVYTAYEVLAFFYNLDKTNIENNLKDILATQAVMDAFSDVRLVIDGKEQRVQRSKNTKGVNENSQDNRRPYYSGKKIDGANHDLALLRHSGLLEQLESDEAAMMDKDYTDIANDYLGTKAYLPHKARRRSPTGGGIKVIQPITGALSDRLEHTVAQMNGGQVLRQVFRHRCESHMRLLRIVAGLVNRQIQARPLTT